MSIFWKCRIIIQVLRQNYMPALFGLWEMAKKKRKVDSMDKNAKEFDVMNESSWEKEVIIAMMSIKPPANNNPFHSTPTKGHIFLPFS